MNISKEKFQNTMDIYRRDFPHLNYFTIAEQEELVLKADKKARRISANFAAILHSLIFEEGIIRGKRICWNSL